MTDVALVWDNMQADSAVEGADLLAEEGLQTAIVLSLFCDRRADGVDELPTGETSLRGWWADHAGPAGDRIGSKLWLLSREKRVPETLRRAKQYCEEALAWLVDDGVASKVEVATSWLSIAELTHSGARPYDYALVIEVRVHRPGNTHDSFRFEYNWNKQLERTA